ncbi:MULTISPECIES: hypothetical protein [unclassified Modicisalibacter]|uniref:hypothetical protein n=1 Tax=unclassified Modicisalibacter TaxID=2679913 RepID=UPI001CCDDC2B|nr:MULTISPECIES: hypothetical protein [unclassified Modicisalibacter]MBZ9558071.1 hypothetical protein [Modicisalibacter sp. R2A 31.J]MBZ9573260.1 hypothetical protein [Modicisalibacter sp. MOD 31.J]
MPGRHAPPSLGAPRTATTARCSPPTLTRRQALGLLLTPIAAAWLAPLAAGDGGVGAVPRRDLGVWVDGWLLDSGDL